MSGFPDVVYAVRAGEDDEGELFADKYEADRAFDEALHECEVEGAEPDVSMVAYYRQARIDAATVERCAVALRERVAGPANAIGAEGHRVLRDAALAVLRAAGLEVES